MPFPSRFGSLANAKPEEAKAELEQLLETHGGDVLEVAEELDVSRRQLDRWLTRFDLLERAAEIRAKVGAKGEAT